MKSGKEVNGRFVQTRVRRLVTTIVAGVVGAYAAYLLIANPLTVFWISGLRENVPLADFGSFYASGLAASQGLDPFDVYPLTLDAELGRGTGAAPNLNAPASVPVFQLLTLVDPPTGRWAWYAATIAAYALMIGLLMRAFPTFRGRVPFVWAFALAGFFETAVLGQVYVLLGLLSTIALLLLRRSPATAGGLIGFVVAFKPNFLVWPILLVLSGERRVGLVALVAAGVFGLLPVLLYGPRVYSQWLVGLSMEHVNPQVANASLPGVIVRSGLPQTVGIVLAGALLIGLAIWALRRRPSAPKASGVALIGLLLAAPLAWVGYSVFLVPIFARLRPTLLLVIAGTLLCIPRVLLQDWADASALARLSVGSAYTVAWLILMGHELVGVSHRSSSSDRD